jgi:AraC-like DNA-binding protein
MKKGYSQIEKNGNFMISRAPNIPEGFNVAGHTHDTFELYYMISGECRYFIGNRVLQVCSNNLILIPKGVHHKTRYSDCACDRMLMMFSGNYISPVLLPAIYRLFPNNIYAPNEKNKTKILELFDKMIRENEKKDLLSDELIKCYITELFSLILRSEMEENHYEKGNIIIDDAIEYIRKNFSEEITLSALAKRSAMSESRFSRVFKEVVGIGYKEYLNSVRLNQANRLLLNTSQSVSDIAYACGFNDSNYFSTFFKKTNGMSPLEFRKLNSGDKP